MSSILKALEKVETNLADQKRHRPSSGSGRRRRAVIHRFEKPLGRSRAIAWAACIVLAGLSGWWLVVNRPAWLGGPADRAAAPSAQTPAASGTPVPAAGPTPAGPDISRTDTPLQPQTTPPLENPARTAADARPVTGAGFDSGEPAPPPIQEPAGGDDDVQKGLAALGPGPDTPPTEEDYADDNVVFEPESARPPPTEDPPKETSAELPILTESDLELHAIAWSREPGQRIAVINNSIVREGEVVEGFDIVSISADGIVVEKDREQWRLMLR